MDLVKAYKYFSEERIKMIKSLADTDQTLEKMKKNLKQLENEKASEDKITMRKNLINLYQASGDKTREELDIYFEAAESIKAIIALKNHVKTKGCDLYWELENVLSPALKEWVYGKE